MGVHLEERSPLVIKHAYLKQQSFCKESVILNVSTCDPKEQLTHTVLSNLLLRSIIQIHLVLVRYL